jgi:hypothetical protein
MKTKTQDRICALLDGEAAGETATPAEQAAVARYRAALARLERAHVSAPGGLAKSILAAVRPPPRGATFREWLAGLLPRRQQWALPAFAGALAMLVILVGLDHLPASGPQPVQVHFQIHAPGAQQVELVGNFNNWTPGTIRLLGPDASGHWTAEVSLPEGRYEYQFLVNGKSWVTDPDAPTHRPDGFGRKNAVIDVFDERS